MVRDYLSKNIMLMIPIVVALSLVACKQETKGLRVEEYSAVPTIVESPISKKELPSNLQYGKILSPVFPDSMRAESNLLRQVASYNSALLHGDINTCSKYLYPDAFKYCKRFYPDYPDEEIIKDFFKSESEDLKESLSKWAKQGIDVQIIVSNFERKIEFQDDIIITFNVTTNLCSDEVYIHFAESEKTIGISHNNGTNWWFMNNHDDLPAILAMHYPQEVINAVMNY